MSKEPWRTTSELMRAGDWTAANAGRDCLPRRARGPHSRRRGPPHWCRSRLRLRFLRRRPLAYASATWASRSPRRLPRPPPWWSFWRHTLPARRPSARAPVFLSASVAAWPDRLRSPSRRVRAGRLSFAPRKGTVSFARRFKLLSVDRSLLLSPPPVPTCFCPPLGRRPLAANEPCRLAQRGLPSSRRQPIVTQRRGSMGGKAGGGGWLDGRCAAISGPSAVEERPACGPASLRGRYP